MAQTPVPSPAAPLASATPSDAVPTLTGTPAPNDLGFYIDTANLALQISVGVITVVTLFLAVLAFFGIKEMASLRRHQRELTEALSRAEGTRASLEASQQNLRTDLETLVMTAHLFNRGQDEYAKADYDRAVTYYEQALRLQPENAQIQVRLARAFVNKSFTGRAERILRSVTTKEPDNADAWRALSTCRRYIDLAEAVTFAERAVDVEPESTDNWNYLGLLLRDAGRYNDSLSAFQEAQRLAPRDPFSLFYQALILLKLGRGQEAARSFRDAHAEAEALRGARRIKEIWHLTIEWGYRKNLDTPEQDQEANAIAHHLSRACKEARDRQSVLGHLIFYLAASGTEPASDLSVTAFPAQDVAIAVGRATRTVRPQ